MVEKKKTVGSRRSKRPFHVVGGSRELPSEFSGQSPPLPMHAPAAPSGGALILQKVSAKSVCKSQFPHKSVNLIFILAMIKNRLTDLCRN